MNTAGSLWAAMRANVRATVSAGFWVPARWALTIAATVSVTSGSGGRLYGAVTQIACLVADLFQVDAGGLDPERPGHHRAEERCSDQDQQQRPGADVGKQDREQERGRDRADLAHRGG